MLDITPRPSRPAPWPRSLEACARQPSVVLVHGAWSDASSWARLIPLLEAEGLEVLVVRNPLTHLGEAVEATRRAIARASGPVILVGHGFAGSVITEAGLAPGVEALVYLAATAPDVGECDGQLLAGYPRAPAFSTVVIDQHGDAYQTAEGVRAHLATDAPIANMQVLVAAHGPLNARQLADTVSTASWRQRACWALVCERDAVVDPDLAEVCARRMSAKVTRLPAGHGCVLSHPDRVAQVIADAADHVARARQS